MSDPSVPPSEDPVPPTDDTVESGPRRSARSRKKKQPFSPGGSEPQSLDQPVAKRLRGKSPNANRTAQTPVDQPPDDAAALMEEMDHASALAYPRRGPATGVPPDTPPGASQRTTRRTVAAGTTVQTQAVTTGRKKPPPSHTGSSAKATAPATTARKKPPPSPSVASALECTTSTVTVARGARSAAAASLKRIAELGLSSDSDADTSSVDSEAKPTVKKKKATGKKNATVTKSKTTKSTGKKKKPRKPPATAVIARNRKKFFERPEQPQPIITDPPPPTQTGATVDPEVELDLPEKEDLTPGVPKEFQCWKTGWEEVLPEDGKSTFILEDDFNHQVLQEPFANSYISIAQGMSSYLSQQGMENNPVAIFKALMEDAIPMLREYINAAIVEKEGKTSKMKNDYELWEFIALCFLRAGFNMDSGTAYQCMEVVAQSHFLKIMSSQRFNTILACLRAYPTAKRKPSNEEDEWYQEMNVFGRYRKLEEAMFRKSVARLLKLQTSPVLVLDDELVSSRAQDVERKSHSDRKAGKDGPTADLVADAYSQVVYGFRLRQRGVKDLDNVELLLRTLPHAMPSDQPTITFDRGYGKMYFIRLILSMGYNVWTIANWQKSRHPFILSFDVDERKKQWKKEGVSDRAIESRLDTIRDWIFHEDVGLGSESRMAVKEVEGFDLYAVAVRDAFDPKMVENVTQFFASGPLTESLKSTWVGRFKKETLPDNTMFNGKDGHHKEQLEMELLGACSVGSMGQRCADWFLMKCFRLTGTMVHTIWSDMERNDHVVTEELLQEWMSKATKQWFTRFQATPAMKAGTVNERPASIAFSQLDVVTAFYEVGLLVPRGFDTLIGVSPDGIATFVDEHGEEKRCTVEIKTRVGEKAIELAEKISREHGPVIHCDHGDSKYLSCVPTEHRRQVIHQVSVTGASHGAYVVSKVEDGVGSLLYSVFVEYDEKCLDEHHDFLCNVSHAMLRWTRQKPAMERGHLLDTDMPSWVKKEDRVLLKSRYPLWRTCNHWLGDRNQLVEPLKTIKEASQQVYNRGKPGVDKATEMSNSIAFDNHHLTFEQKYVLRMIRAVVINTWKTWIGMTVVAPMWEKDPKPTIEQMKRKMWKVTLSQFTHELAIDLLRTCHQDRFSGVPSPDRARLEATSERRDLRNKMRAAARDNSDLELLEMKNTLKAEGKFNQKYSQWKKWSKDTDSMKWKTLRLANTDTIQHLPVTIPKRRSCAMCSIGNRSGVQTTHMCSICEIPLCVKAIAGEARSCFVVWHQCNDLCQAAKDMSAKRRALKADQDESEDEEVQPRRTSPRRTATGGRGTGGRRQTGGRGRNPGRGEGAAARRTSPRRPTRQSPETNANRAPTRGVVSRRGGGRRGRGTGRRPTRGRGSPLPTASSRSNSPVAGLEAVGNETPITKASV